MPYILTTEPLSATSLGITSFLTATPPDPSSVCIHDHLKRPIEFVIALIGLALSAPVIAALAIVVKLTSRGPAFYAQERVGLGGKPFALYKLRTMYANAEPGGPVWAGLNDPRVTPIGRFLRSTHLDELPQFANVLRGHMSLIGPRPERPYFVERLTHAIPLYAGRLVVRPGVTGLAQVRHHYDRSIEDVYTKLAYDLEYVQRGCLLLDLQIVVLTVLKVINDRDGSA